MKEKVFVTREIPSEGLDIIRSNFETTVWQPEVPPTRDEIVEKAAGCAGLVTLLTDSIDSLVIQSLPDLKAIAQYAVGFDNIDVEFATSRGIVVTNTPGVLTETTADLAWALIMAASRGIPQADRYVKDGKWKVGWGPMMLLGNDIYGATLGVIGMGRIGSAVAHRAKGFSMKILYTDPFENETTKSVEKEIGATRTDLETLLREADIVTIHVPLNPETRGMIDEKELDIMKPGAVLVNTSRGAVINEFALANALRSGHLRSAGLDVFIEEPLPADSSLLKLQNVVLTPHIASASFATRARMATMCAENLIAALKRERPPNVVNPEVFDYN